MFAHKRSPTPKSRKQTAGLGITLLYFAAGCAAVAPALTNFAVAFAQDLLAAVSVNYTPRYATHVEELLVALAREGSNLPLEAQLARSGYQAPSPSYGGPQTQGGYQDPYAQAPQAGGYQDPYAQAPQAGGYQDPYAQAPQAGGYQDPYAQAPQAGGYQDPYAQAPKPDGYDDPHTGGTDDPYTYRTPPVRSAAAPIAMSATLVAQKAGAPGLVTLEDGDVLRDGRGDPARGDRLKVHFQTNCTCYVYVLGIDATGYVANIFPDPDDPGLSNPVQAEKQFVLPRGDDWWGLDDYRGVEQVYFLASHGPRPDVENAMRELGNQPRQISPEAYRPVNEPAVVPVRGMVKVPASQQVSLQTGASLDQVIAATFEATDGRDLVVTRWFRHE